jgi:hypothetical protein
MKYARRHPLAAFFGLAFTMTWGIAAAVWLLSSLDVVSLESPSGLVFLLLMLAIFAPSLWGIVMTAITGGRAGLRELAGRLLKVRVGLRWYVVVLLGVPAAALLASVLAARLTDEVTLRQFDLGTWYLVFPLLVGTLIGGRWARRSDGGGSPYLGCLTAGALCLPACCWASCGDCGTCRPSSCPASER